MNISSPREKHFSETSGLQIFLRYYFLIKKGSDSLFLVNKPENKHLVQSLFLFEWALGHILTLEAHNDIECVVQHICCIPLLGSGRWPMGDPNFPGSAAYRTERVKSPGLLLLGLAKKLPSTPRVSSRFSASTPVMFGWNHLTIRQQVKYLGCIYTYIYTHI